MNLRTFKPWFFVAALIISALLLIEYLSNLIGFSIPYHLPNTLMFFLIFPIWAFTVLYMKQKNQAETLSALPIGEKINAWLGRPGAGGLIIAALLYGNALFCMYLLFTGAMIDPALGIDGRYFYNNHGNITYYTEAEALDMHRKNTMAYSGFLLVFSGLAAIILAPKKDDRQISA